MVTDLQGPTKTQLKEYILASRKIEIKLVNGDVIIAKPKWRDDMALCVERDDGKLLTITNSAVCYYFPLD
ncbi:MAG: hypothetical protein AB1782_15855 [Cyanobacteriota bacterium]